MTKKYKNDKGLLNMTWFIVAFFIIVADQIGKYFIINFVGIGNMIPIIEDFFYITHIYNSGAAWGMFPNGRFFFILITIVVMVFVIYFILKSNKKMLSFALSFILGGAIGNLLDRVIKGSVVDFLDFYIGEYHFPTFNIADSFVVVGTFLLGYYLIFVYKDDDIKCFNPIEAKE